MIAANPALDAAEVTLDATVIFDLECKPASQRGWLDLTGTFVDVEIPAAAALSGGEAAPPWVKNQGTVLSIPPASASCRTVMPTA
jgi:hypothetical protein